MAGLRRLRIPVHNQTPAVPRQFNRAISAETKILKENCFFLTSQKGQFGVANATFHLHTSGCCIYAGQQDTK
jgi:hypothetical protein